MDKDIMKERARIKVIKLRQMASRVNSSLYEPLILFKEIEKDPRCQELLKNCRSANEEEIKYYNEHIRNSKLSEKDKEELII